MTAFVKDEGEDNFERQLAVFTSDESVLSQLANFFEMPSNDLKLVSLKQLGQEKNVRFWQQNNLAISRKQLQPLTAKFLSAYENSKQ